MGNAKNTFLPIGQRTIYFINPLERHFHYGVNVFAFIRRCVGESNFLTWGAKIARDFPRKAKNLNELLRFVFPLI